MSEQILDVCPNWGWKMLIALYRLVGLRRGEALELTWSNIDWQKHRLTLIAKKTGRRRIVPIESKLYELFLDGFEQAEENEGRICLISKHCLWRNLQTICKRAGLKRWKDAFKVMRKNCETDWAQRYPQYAVSMWMGHCIDVSAKHYLQVPEELHEKVVATNIVQTATKSESKMEVALSVVLTVGCGNGRYWT